MPERYPPDDPREWLNRAHSNLIRAKADLDGVYLEDLSFDAQQAAEKAIKGVLMKYGVAFPYIHDIAKLLALVERAGQVVPESVWEGRELTPFAVVTRYPDAALPLSSEEYRELVGIAEEVVRWAETVILREEETQDETDEEIIPC